MGEDDAPFDPERVLRMLAENDVAFVLIGGVAANAWGSPSLTHDIDICPDASMENLERLANVLRELHPVFRDSDVKFDPDPKLFTDTQVLKLATDAGDVDVILIPAGVAGYAELFPNAQKIDGFDGAVYVADIDDLIRMKIAAGRPKDLIEVEVLSALRDEVGDENIEQR